MKKDLIFSSILLFIGISLFCVKLTGRSAHISISAVGIVALVLYTLLSKKEWKFPTFEITMRAFYGIALITGVAVMKIRGIIAISIIHKVSAVWFVVSLIFLLVHKLIAFQKTKNVNIQREENL